MILGDQRPCVAQVEKLKNKRRDRRPSAKRVKPTKPLEERVKHVLATGKLLDYTHPSEVDPFWDKLYKQFEYLQYLTDYYKACIAQSNLDLSDNELNEIVKDLHILKQYRAMYLKYLMSGLQLLYGSVMNKKFYGWFHSVHRFVERFNEEALMTLSRLRFDPDRTRCSVYFYQVFWLSGLAVKNEISEELNPDYNDEISITDEKLRGGTVTPFDSMYERYTKNVEDRLIDEIDNDTSNELPAELLDIVEKLLAKLGLTVGALSNKKAIHEISMGIRRQLKAGKLTLTERDKEVLKKYGFDLATIK